MADKDEIDPKAVSLNPNERRESIKESIIGAVKEVRTRHGLMADKPEELADEEIKPQDNGEEIKPVITEQLDDPAKPALPSEGDEPKPQLGENEPKPTGLAAPASWTSEARSKWHEVPPELQQEITRREEAGAKGIAELKARYTDIDGVLAPWNDMIRRNGRTPAQTIDAMFRWYAGLSGPDKVNAFRTLATQFSVDLAQVVPTAAAPISSETSPVNPDLSNALKPLQDELRTLKTQADFDRQQREKVEWERGQRQLEEWSQDKPFYERVRGKMHQLMALDAAALSQGLTPQNGFIKSDGTVDLDQCYQVACNTDASIRQEMDAARFAEAEKKAKEAAAAEIRKAQEAANRKAQEVARARNAGGSLPTGTTPAAPVLGGKPVKETAGDSVRRAVAEFKANSQGRI